MSINNSSINNNNNSSLWTTFGGLTIEQTDNLAVIAATALMMRAFNELREDVDLNVSPEVKRVRLEAGRQQKKLNEIPWLTENWYQDLETLYEKVENEEENFQQYEKVSLVDQRLKWDLLSFVQINDVFRENIGDLNLSHHGLTCLPALAIQWFSQIEYLNLSHNNLETLPEEIGQLENVTEINISYNPLKKDKISPTIFKNLTHTDILISDGQQDLITLELDATSAFVGCELEELVHKERSKQ